MNVLTVLLQAPAGAAGGDVFDGIGDPAIFHLAVRRFDEQLRLVLRINAPFQLLDRIRTL